MKYYQDTLKHLYEEDGTVVCLVGFPQNAEELAQSVYVSDPEIGITDTLVSSDIIDRIVAKESEIRGGIMLTELREKRNELLAETDHYALSDVPVADEMLAYRQALRDITSTYTSLDDVVWPTKPE